MERWELKDFMQKYWGIHDVLTVLGKEEKLYTPIIWGAFLLGKPPSLYGFNFSNIREQRLKIAYGSLYPLYCFKVGEAVSSKKAQRGIFICKTGIGSCIALNKVKGIRAGLVYNIKAAKFSRLHNDTNVLSLAADKISVSKAKDITKVWLKTKALKGRHARRVNQIKKQEKKDFRKR